MSKSAWHSWGGHNITISLLGLVDRSWNVSRLNRQAAVPMDMSTEPIYFLPPNLSNSHRGRRSADIGDQYIAKSPVVRSVYSFIPLHHTGSFAFHLRQAVRSSPLHNSGIVPAAATTLGNSDTLYVPIPVGTVADAI